MQDQDKILNFLKITGPTLPAKVAKNIQSDILLASALLSDLVSQGKVKISKLKIGGSPLYYLPGQESQLYNFAAGNVNHKDLQVLNKLKQEKVLREHTLELLEKVALRSLKDFAVPLNVNIQGKTELFWKWHLLKDEEANNVIREILTGVPEKKVEQPEPKQEETVLPQPETAERGEEQKKLDQVEEKKPLLRKIKDKVIKKKRRVVPDEFLPRAEGFFDKLNVVIEQKETLRKNSEINFLIKVPSVMGKITYFCKAKNKNRCDEKDLSAAYMEAQVKKLPLLFLYTNEITKKAREMLESGTFENIIVKRME